MSYVLHNAESLPWATRPHERDEPARHVAELPGPAGYRTNLWRYDPGACGKRHLHDVQEESFTVLAGELTMYLGHPAIPVVVGAGSTLHVPAGTPLQAANHGAEDVMVLAIGAPPDDGATVLDSVL